MYNSDAYRCEEGRTGSRGDVEGLAAIVFVLVELYWDAVRTGMDYRD